jgi:hypothetical protein
LPSLDDVYRKFGFAAEAAQLLETELGTALFLAEAAEKDLLSKPDPKAATEIDRKIDRMTLGQIISTLKKWKGSALPPGIDFTGIESLLATALDARNQLQHSFYRRHNFRRNSEEGRELMLADLESIHNVILDAYKAVVLIGGIDLDDLVAQDPQLPTKHLPI